MKLNGNGLYWLGLSALCGALVLGGCQSTKQGAGDHPVATTSPDSGKADSGKDAPFGETPPLPPPDGSDPQLPRPDKDHRPTKVMKVPPLASHGWAKASIKPQELAAKIDKAFGELAGVQNQAIVSYILPTGTGQIRLESQWQSPKVFNVQYPGVLEGHPTLESVRSNGQMVATLKSYVKGKSISGGKGAWSDLHPIGEVSTADGSHVAKEWPTDMPRIAFGRFTAGQEVFGPLVASLAKDPTIELVTEERSTAYGKMLITDYRIVAQRKESAVAQKGDLQIEIVIDSKHFVPVTMRTRYGPIGKQITEIDWAGRWAEGKFSASKFEVPKSTS